MKMKHYLDILNDLETLKGELSFVQTAPEQAVIAAYNVDYRHEIETILKEDIEIAGKEYEIARKRYEACRPLTYEEERDMRYLTDLELGAIC
ncbi:hypothetical protein Barb6_01963 [Bacteroidales bacterium Barb6]|nr:hypothetical protein Barb6_01963 [Bacteroidales bacterium Barb6]